MLVEETQLLPYRICNCRLLEDVNVESSKLFQHQQEILDLMIAILQREAPAELAKFDQEGWNTLDPKKFSFEIFKLIRFDPDLMQSLLEMTDPEKRLILIKDKNTFYLQSYNATLKKLEIIVKLKKLAP